MKMFSLWLIGVRSVGPHRPGSTDPQPPTTHTRPPACPLCHGRGWSVGFAIVGGVVLPCPTLLRCQGCGGTGVLPASIVRGRSLAEVISLLGRKMVEEYEARARLN